MPTNNFGILGLNSEEVTKARKKHGYNRFEYKNENSLLHSLLGAAKEPMVILLFVASSVYFISGDTGNGIFLSGAIVFSSCIAMYQNSRSKNALEKLKKLTQPKSKVIRNGDIVEIENEELVVGDSLMVEEGASINADCTIVHSNDFSVNESILTGESVPVSKDKDTEDNVLFSGTTVAGGLAIATITAIGNETKLGKIGKSIESIKEEKTPLEIQVGNFVKKMVIAGAIVFITVWGVNYFHSRNLLDSLLKSLTLAMSIIPEEIPVAFTTFMALGAWRLMKMGIVVKQTKTVETLGSSTVICIDKTGTITENKMSLAKLFVIKTQEISSVDDTYNDDEKELITTAMWASEPIPFDPMEVALHDAYVSAALEDKRVHYKIIHEYPLGGTPPMMTHLFEDEKGHRIIAAKGAPEALVAASTLTDEEKKQIETAIATLTTEGYRILGIAGAEFDGTNYPEKQQDFNFIFKGIVAFYDPPKKNIQKVLEAFYKAGIVVKIITGDYAATTQAIAKQVGFKGYENNIEGDKLMQLSDAELKKTVKNTNLFSRMYPEAKLKIINALKANYEIVAMTGDGVNDAPALKAAHIGIAMGKKGTEIAKQAASLILIEDDLSKMVDAVAMGRKIYANLKKAIQYIISIHIPIILTVFLPLVLGWRFPNIFSPIHVIFLELIMGPTCSISYENEPMEKNTMAQKPRPMANTFFNLKELTTSIVQGLMITAGTLFAYQYAVQNEYSEALTRTMVFTVLITSNIILTLVNRSFYYSVVSTLKNKNPTIAIIIGITLAISAAMLYITPLSTFFQFEHLSTLQLLFSIAIGMSSVLWYELVKLWKRSRGNEKLV